MQILGYTNIFHGIFTILILVLNMKKPWNEQVFFVMQTGTVQLTLSIAMILSKISLATIDFAVMLIVGTRCAMTFIIFYFVLNGTEGFELIDPKYMSDSIPIIATSCFACAVSNFKRDLLLTAPITIILSIIATNKAYSVDNDNMNCFVEPEKQAMRMSQRWSIQIIAMVVIAYVYRKMTLQRFIE